MLTLLVLGKKICVYMLTFGSWESVYHICNAFRIWGALMPFSLVTFACFLFILCVLSPTLVPPERLPESPLYRTMSTTGSTRLNISCALIFALNSHTHTKPIVLTRKSSSLFENRDKDSKLKNRRRKGFLDSLGFVVL